MRTRLQKPSTAERCDGQRIDFKEQANTGAVTVVYGTDRVEASLSRAYGLGGSDSVTRTEHIVPGRESTRHRHKEARDDRSSDSINHAHINQGSINHISHEGIRRVIKGNKHSFVF